MRTANHELIAEVGLTKSHVSNYLKKHRRMARLEAQHNAHAAEAAHPPTSPSPPATAAKRQLVVAAHPPTSPSPPATTAKRPKVVASPSPSPSPSAYGLQLGGIGNDAETERCEKETQPTRQYFDALLQKKAPRRQITPTHSAAHPHSCRPPPSTANTSASLACSSSFLGPVVTAPHPPTQQRVHHVCGSARPPPGYRVVLPPPLGPFRDPLFTADDPHPLRRTAISEGLPVQPKCAEALRRAKHGEHASAEALLPLVEDMCLLFWVEGLKQLKRKTLNAQDHPAAPPPALCSAGSFPFVASTLRYLEYPRLTQLLTSYEHHQRVEPARRRSQDHADTSGLFLFSRELLLTLAYLIATRSLLSDYHRPRPDLPFLRDEDMEGAKLVAPVDTSSFPSVVKTSGDATTTFTAKFARKGPLELARDDIRRRQSSPTQRQSHLSIISVTLASWLMQMTLRVKSIHSSIRHLDSHRLLMLHRFEQRIRALMKLSGSHDLGPPTVCDFTICRQPSVYEQVVAQLQRYQQLVEQWQRQSVFWRWMQTVLDEADHIERERRDSRGAREEGAGGWEERERDGEKAPGNSVVLPVDPFMSGDQLSENVSFVSALLTHKGLPDPLPVSPFPFAALIDKGSGCGSAVAPDTQHNREPSQDTIGWLSTVQRSYVSSGHKPKATFVPAHSEPAFFNFVSEKWTRMMSEQRTQALQQVQSGDSTLEAELLSAYLNAVASVCAAYLPLPEDLGKHLHRIVLDWSLLSRSSSPSDPSAVCPSVRSTSPHPASRTPPPPMRQQTNKPPQQQWPFPFPPQHKPTDKRQAALDKARRSHLRLLRRSVGGLAHLVKPTDVSNPSLSSNKGKETPVCAPPPGVAAAAAAAGAAEQHDSGGDGEGTDESAAFLARESEGEAWDGDKTPSFVWALRQRRAAEGARQQELSSHVHERLRRVTAKMEAKLGIRVVP
ncbi:unnamed protein product [Vitrella brassicaformis CCMP3155]|uniref:Uncharacterized protein n=1 Tax=Vitrella brassicaformis (strain CCMP3155) TaxID=1169540 RepID=A0A0G4EG24_VITBC|nr:unnamed protein product [Vitrella brassicaformis CCMP3155]|eukprot:CEL94428.1 unnamed protein product [Vitrella brassicaformis CCMP3155]